jgi:hypothetical protein
MRRIRLSIEIALTITSFLSVLGAQTCPACSGTAQCVDGVPVCQANGQWMCAGGGVPCVAPEPAPCCQECYETCTIRVGRALAALLSSTRRVRAST